MTKRKVLPLITGGRNPVSSMKLFFQVPEMCKNYPFFIFFLKETSEQQEGRLLAVVTFCLFFSTRFVFS